MAIRWIDTAKLIFGNFVKKLCFLLLRLVIVGFQSVQWKINGIKGPIERNMDGERKCAQALKLRAWYKYCLLLPPSLRDFILTHDEYLEPEYVIQNDHVSLFFFDPHEDVAVFGEGKPGQMLWKSEYAPFITISIAENAQRLIVMPMSEFRRLCAILPEPKGRIIIMGNTARCGSTMLTQIFECTDSVISYSEPYPANNLAVLYRKEGDCPEVHQMTRNFIRMYCRPLKGLPNPEGYLIKPTGPSFVCAEIIKKLYPGTKVFFLYRNMDNVTKSMYKLSFKLPLTRMTYLFCRVYGPLVEKLFALGGFPTDGTNRTLKDDYSSGIFQAVVATRVYLKMRGTDSDVHGLLFDDLIKDKEKGVRAILKACDLPQRLVPKAMAAFTRDSQRGCFVSKAEFAKIAPLEFTKEDQIRGNQVLAEFGFPPLDQPCHLKGTLNFDEILEE